MKRTFVISSSQYLDYLAAELRGFVRDGLVMQVDLSEYKVNRSSEQNRKLHALIADIANSQKWAGRDWDIEQWKRLLTAAWCRARGEGSQIVPALDGHGFDVLYQHTSKLSVSECSELIEYVTAWAIEQGVRLSEAA